MRGQVAQLVEQRTENPRVGGSIPSLAMLNHYNELDHLNARQKWWAFGFPVPYSIERRSEKSFCINDLLASASTPSLSQLPHKHPPSPGIDPSVEGFDLLTCEPQEQTLQHSRQFAQSCHSRIRTLDAPSRIRV
jgi:hypothetical protein